MRKANRSELRVIYMEYETLISAARSIAYKNGVPLDIGMLWARQGVAGGQITIIGKPRKDEDNE